MKPPVQFPLGALKPGHTAVVVDYSVDRAVRRRFVEMGLIPGVAVTAVRSAPLGDPIEFAVMGSRLSIRKEDAGAVLVEEQVR
jgi:Fe2+ transport system protein FeoA